MDIKLRDYFGVVVQCFSSERVEDGRELRSRVVSWNSIKSVG